MPMSVPPTTLMPTEFCAPEPAPVAMARGSTPSRKAMEVMAIGRNRMRAASSTDCSNVSPWALRSRAHTGGDETGYAFINPGMSFCNHASCAHLRSPDFENMIVERYDQIIADGLAGGTIFGNPFGPRVTG